MKQLHPIQLQILKKLLFAKQLRYHETKPDKEMENNQFGFHLDQLISDSYILKENKHYLLTNFGKEYANRLDSQETTIARQAKVSVMICCLRGTNKETEYLIYTRLKQPFYGCQGFLSGKVKFGETIEQAVRRELKEEANLEGDPEIINIKHYLVYNKVGKELLEDKFMFYCQVKNPSGQLKGNDEGKFAWVAEKDLKTHVTNHFESWTAFKNHLNEVKKFSGHVVVQEIYHESEKF